MSKSNYAPPENGAVYFLNYDLFMDESTRFLDESLMSDFQNEIVKKFCQRFPSFSPCKRSYVDRITEKAAESSLFWIGFADNQWSLAVVLGAQDVNLGLIKTHYNTYKKGLEKILLDIFPAIGFYKSPYTHGVKTKEPA